MPSNASEERAACGVSVWRRPAVAAALLMALALGLRLLRLGWQSLWLDEAMSYHFARLDGAAFRHLLWTRELNMAPYYLLLRGWTEWGTSEAHLRLLSVIPAVLTVGVVYAIGARLWSHRAGVLAALLLAVHAAHVAYAQEARAYALATLLVSLAALFLLRALGVGKADAPTGSAWDWALFAGCGAAAIYSQFFAGFAIAALFASLGGARERRVPWGKAVGAALAIGVLIAPAVWFAVSVREDPLGWIGALTFTPFFKSLAAEAGWSVALLAMLPLWYVAARRAARGEWAARFVLLWLWLPLLVLTLISVVKPVLHPRFVQMSVPAAALAAAAGIEGLALHWRRERVLLSATLLISLAGVVDYYRHPKQDWRGATAYVLREMRAGDAVFYGASCGPFGFDYYQRALPAEQRVVLKPEEQMAAALVEGKDGRFWAVRCPGKLRAEMAAHLESPLKRLEQRRFYQVEVFVYGIRESGN
jgi:mannosyltransferase